MLWWAEYLYHSVYREPQVVKSGSWTIKKNSPEHAEESILLLDPHVCADDTAMKEGCTAANLGGTAEAVFRPMGEKDSFLLFFGVFPTTRYF